MLFATPLVREQIKLDPRYTEAETITNDDLAKIALERRGLRDLELLRHVNAMIGELGDSTIAFRLYNASDERLWLHRDHYSGEASIFKYPPDYIVDPGQWSVFVAKGSINPDGVVYGKLSISYRCGKSDLVAQWGCASSDCFVSIGKEIKLSTVAQPMAASQDGRVAAITRGYLGDSIVIDGLYTRKTQYPFV